MKESLLKILKKSACIFTFLGMILVGESVNAQEVNVLGVVRDSVGGLPGVSVKVSGTNQGVQTDQVGRFRIKADKNAVLVFSFIGFKNQQIQLSRQKASASGDINLEVKMVNDDAALEEVTVVGFGTQKKTSIVSSITTISPKELKGPTSNLTSMLQGRVAGMIAFQRSGEPGADNAQFFIRGLGSFGSGKVDPLILIDGMESTQNDMARLQPDDIASFSVLKDATAAAVYGARGANGVVLVSTKSGEAGKTKFNFRAENSVSSNTRNFQFADNITYMQLANEAVLTRPSTSQTLPYWQTKIDHTAAGDDPLLYPNNNWIDQLIKDYTMNQRYNLSVSGGGVKARYYVAGTYNLDNGILKVDPVNNFNSNVRLKNYSVRSNVNLNFTPTTEAIIRVYAQFDDYTGPVGGYDSNGNRINGGQKVFNMAIWSNPVMFAPVYPSSYSQFSTHPLFGNAMSRNRGLLTNPYAEMVRGYQEYNNSTILPQIELKQDLNTVVTGLSARVMANIRRYSYFDVARQYNPFYYTASVSPAESGLLLTPLNDGGASSIGTVGTEYLGYSEGNKELSSSFYVEAATNYNRTFGEKHAVTGMIIGLMQNRLNGNAGSLQLSLPARNLGVSGRFTYGFDNRYMAEFNFGYNGTERFAKDNRMGFFPSFGLAYNVSNEKFFEGIKGTVNNLKLRATYGLVGNDQIGNAADRFFYMSEVNMNDGLFSSSFGENNTYTRNGISISRYANPLITWETSRQINLGADVRMFNALDINIDVYKQTRSNILTARTYIPTSMGLQASIVANTNKARSEGFDLALAYNKSLGNDFYVQSRGNLTYARSKKLIVDEPAYAQAYSYSAGTPVGQTFGYIAERLFVDDEETLNSPVQFGTPGVDYLGGDIKYKDVNNDGVINTDDMVPLGLPTTPEITYGFGGTIGYKNFDISAFLQGSARSSFFINPNNISPFYLNGGAQNGLLNVIAESHWSEENRNSYAFWPRLSENLNTNNNQTSSWWMRNGSFLRLKNVELGYTPGDKFRKRFGLGNMRIYVNAANLFVISKFKMWDPEMGGQGLGYPIQTVYNLGANVSF